MSSGDAGADIRAMAALQEQVDALQAHVDALITANLGRAALITDGRERADRQDAELVKLKGQVSALSGRVIALENPEPGPGPKLVDSRGMPEADRLAMVKRLQVRTAAGIEANKSDRYRAGRTYRKEADNA